MKPGRQHLLGHQPQIGYTFSRRVAPGARTEPGRVSAQVKPRATVIIRARDGIRRPARITERGYHANERCDAFASGSCFSAQVRKRRTTMSTLCELCRSDASDSMRGRTSSAAVREISQRVSCGLEITLLWHGREQVLSVMLQNLNTGATLELLADPAAARYAFEHPFPYATRLHIDYEHLLRV